jgi:hypothetical protein
MMMNDNWKVKASDSVHRIARLHEATTTTTHWQTVTHRDEYIPPDRDAQAPGLRLSIAPKQLDNSGGVQDSESV